MTTATLSRVVAYPGFLTDCTGCHGGAWIVPTRGPIDEAPARFCEAGHPVTSKGYMTVPDDLLGEPGFRPADLFDIE